MLPTRKAAYIIILCILLSGCSPAPSLHTEPSSTVTQRVTAKPTVSQPVTTAPTTTLPATPQPTATPTTARPTLSLQTVTLTSVQPSATPHATANPTTKPTPKGDYEYYIVDQNGRQGVVDGTGKMILPFRFTVIEPVVYYSSYSAQRIVPAGPMLFLAQPAAIQYENDEWDPISAARYLYNAKGKQVSKQAYYHAFSLGKDLLQVVTKDAASGLRKAGVITLTGKVVIPCAYDWIDLFDNGNMMAVKGEEAERTVTILNRQGNVLRKRKLNVMSITNNLMIVRDESNLCGLMDDQFRWVVPAEWAEIQASGPDHYIVTLNGLSGVVNAHGDPIIPISYRGLYGISDPTRTERMLYQANHDEKGIVILDDTGAIIFQSRLYTYIHYRNGVFLLSDLETSAALDLNRQTLLSGMAKNSDWNAEYQIYQCWDNNRYYCYTADGQMLPLPESETGRILTGNCFLLTKNYETGLCDAQGQWIVPPERFQTFDPLLPVETGLLIRKQMQLDKEEYSLIDIDGQTVTNQKFDQLRASTSYQNLLYARIGPIYGLIDHKGNWVWYTSDYNMLMD